MPEHPVQTMTELMQQVLSILPNASFEEDHVGQIVIYTDCWLAPDGETLGRWEGNQ